MGVKDSAGAPDCLVDDLNEDSEKAVKSAREKELAAINDYLLHLFLLTEVSLGLAAPFFKCDEISGQSFSETAVAINSPGISLDLTLNLKGDHSGPNIYDPAFSTIGNKGWSYQFSIIFRSLNKEVNKEIKFSLNKEELESIQSLVSPASGWMLFRELYFENNGEFCSSMFIAIQGLMNAVGRFFEKKVLAIQTKEGLNAGFERIFEINVDTMVNLMIKFKKVWAFYQNYQQAFLAYGPLVFETCQALRDTKGFVKSKKLAEIREKLERRSKEISASINV